MKNKRRDFLKFSALTGLSLTAAGKFPQLGEAMNLDAIRPQNFAAADPALSVIGQYGPWASSFNDNKIPSLSFRNKEWSNADQWRDVARKRAIERMGVPDIGGMPEVKVTGQSAFDGLIIEELSWQLPYGRPTEALLLRPANQKGPLPGILAFHDHGGNKYFGTRKITRTAVQHPLMVQHQKDYYGGFAWANEIAKRGYVVMVSDAFTFASRRVMMGDVPELLRHGHNDQNPEDPENIAKYNEWAGQHEHIMAKSLFCAGTTWPGVFFAEDRKALDILCSRKEVDANRIGCGGLSGGGLRTVISGGLDPRIKCAVCVGFMTTWKDFLLNKSFTHTWMTYVPMLPNELDFPEILALRVPLATLVLNDQDDFLYTMPEMKRANEIISQVFAKAGAQEKYKCSFYPGPHKFDAEMQKEAFAWFDRWLK